MLVVKIELHSAVTHKVTEIGRMHIINDGTGTHDRGNYEVQIMRKGTTGKVQKRGRVQDYPRLSYTVWELVRRALVAGLGKWPIHPGEPEEFDQDVKLLTGKSRVVSDDNGITITAHEVTDACRQMLNVGKAKLGQ